MAYSYNLGGRQADAIRCCVMIQKKKFWLLHNHGQAFEINNHIILNMQIFIVNIYKGFFLYCISFFSTNLDKRTWPETMILYRALE